MTEQKTASETSAAFDQKGGLLASISREMVRAMKTYYGKGPEKAKSYLVDDLLFVVMRGGATIAEQTMLEAGQEDAVRDFRQRFENEMEERLTYVVEQLTKRRVVNYQSQVLFEPDVTIEIFMFDKPIAEDARRETAEALMDPDSGVGEVPGDEVEPAVESDDTEARRSEKN